MYTYYVAYLYIKFVNTYILNDIAHSIYVYVHIYRVLSHTHVYMLKMVALIHKQFFSYLTFMFFPYCPTNETRLLLIIHVSIQSVRTD